MNAKYYIYRNLRTGGFSIRYKGKVIERNDTITAENIVFRVSEKGWRRVIKEKQKNVHAYIVCDKYFLDADKVDGCKIVSYNPYIAPNFVCDGLGITQAEKVICKNGKCYLVE